MKQDTDIDIDFAERNDALSVIPHIAAMTIRVEGKVRHPSGVYFQDVPVDPITGLCAFDYKQASNYYTKIDILSNSIYANVRNEEHLLELMQEPDWRLFEFEEIVSQLAHIKDHFYVVKKIKPKSVEDLAVCLALIRPGKKNLLHKDRKEIDKEIWKKEDDYSFKRAHAIAYSFSIIVQLNTLCETMFDE